VRGEASTLGMLGMVAREQYEFDKAMEHYQRGLVLMRQVGAPTGEANALEHIGIVHAERGEHDEALAHLEKALPLLKSRGDVRSYAGVLHDLAYVHFGVFNDEESKSCAERSLAAYRESGDRRGESIATAEFAYWRYEMEDFAAVREMVRDVLRLCRAYMNLPDDHAVLEAMEEIRDRIGQITMLVALSLAAQVDGRLTEALEHAERCLTIVRSSSRWWSVYKVLGQLSTLHLALGDRETGRGRRAAAPAQGDGRGEANPRYSHSASSTSVVATPATSAMAVYWAILSVVLRISGSPRW
jgi:tetratricopeptide (TPR) repeat protein